MNKWRVALWAGLILLFSIPPLIPRKEEPKFMAPRFPKEIVKEPSDLELKAVARVIAHQPSGNVRLGTIRSGERALIVLPNRRQDMRLIKAVVEAMKERGITVEYVFEDDFLEDVMGIAKGSMRALGAAFGGGSSKDPDALLKQLRQVTGQMWPRYLPPNLRPRERSGPEAIDTNHNPYTMAIQEAMRRYVTELHPEYDAVVGGRPRQEYMTQRVGPKWRCLWEYTTVSDFELINTRNYPADVWRISEDKLMEVLPWVEEVHIYDPEGTDIRFSITPKEAELWAKGAFQPNHVFMNPLQGTRSIFWNHGLHDVVVPKINGVVAGTKNGGGVFPLLKLYIEDGLVTRVEGSGPAKDVAEAYRANEVLSNVQIPHFPKKGFFWLYEFSFGSNPKFGSNSPGLGGQFRSGVFHWGFGVEHGNPEIEQYLKEHNLPNDHRDTFSTFFTTYEVKLRGRNHWVKLVDRGRLAVLDDPEVRALASRYGNADEILAERWVPAVPGINVPGDYYQDYAKDPAPYIVRITQQLWDGTYPYLK